MSADLPIVLVVNGPNLNLLGVREPHLYGHTTLAELEQKLSAHAARIGCQVEFRQSNSESEIIDALHEARGRVEAVVLNPGAFAHYSHAIADAISATQVRVVEVHLTNIFAREEFRRHSVIAPVAEAVIAGTGTIGYELALEAVLRTRE